MSFTAKNDSIQVNEYSYSWLSRGFDWVYKNEIRKKQGSFKVGDWIEVYSPHNAFLGTGIWCGGHVAFRRFSTERVEPTILLTQRLQEALARRPSFPPTAAWRWVHAENDQLPGVRIDVWGTEIVLTLADPALKCLIKPLLGAIRSCFTYTSIWGYVRAEKVEHLGCLSGRGDTEGQWVEELGLRYWVEPNRSPDAGLFSDMRALRDWLTPYWKEKRCLNLFCFTGAFSVSAASNGAKQVTSVDLSSTYIDWVQKNFIANDLSCDGHRFFAEDALKALDRFRRKQERFDMIVADPPSFSHGDAIWSVEKGLSGLVAGCLRVLEPQGWLVIATNHGKMSPKDFAKAILDASVRTKRPVRILKQYNPPIDFPAALSFPESRYLKCWVIQA
ncbi:MAG: class I SAM-dependent rRNA methyltransferase [Myxococcota bacterium]|nr:class I SAM-dependent rRNA methyltransferase [Myxococcota bacterium]